MRSYYFVLGGGSGTDNLGAMALSGDHEALTFAQQVIADLVHEAAEEYSGCTIEVISDQPSVGRIPFNSQFFRLTKPKFGHNLSE